MIVKVCQRFFLHGVNTIAEILHGIKACAPALQKHLAQPDFVWIDSFDQAVNLIHQILDTLKFLRRKFPVLKRGCDSRPQFRALVSCLFDGQIHSRADHLYQSRVHGIVRVGFVFAVFVRLSVNQVGDGNILGRIVCDCFFQRPDILFSLLVDRNLFVRCDFGVRDHLRPEVFNKLLPGAFVSFNRLLGGIAERLEILRLGLQVFSCAFHGFVDRAQINRHISEVVFQGKFVNLVQIPGQHTDADCGCHDSNPGSAEIPEQFHCQSERHKPRPHGANGRRRSCDGRQQFRACSVQRVNKPAEQAVRVLNRPAQNLTDFPAEFLPLALEKLFASHESARLDPGHLRRVSFAVKNLVQQTVVVFRRGLQKRHSARDRARREDSGKHFIPLFWRH